MVVVGYGVRGPRDADSAGSVGLGPVGSEMRFSPFREKPIPFLTALQIISREKGFSMVAGVCRLRYWLGYCQLRVAVAHSQSSLRLNWRLQFVGHRR